MAEQSKEELTQTEGQEGFLEQLIFKLKPEGRISAYNYAQGSFLYIFSYNTQGPY